MAAKRAKRRPGSPHRMIRRSCKHCKRSRHNHVPGTGNAHRFHGIGSFCRTHKTTRRGKLFCKTPATRSSRGR